jgi:hypothetical protein
MSDLKKMDESRANKIIEQVQEEQAQKEINDIKEKGKSIGLSMEGFSDLDVPVDQAPLLQPINGKYRIDQQHFALNVSGSIPKRKPCIWRTCAYVRSYFKDARHT